MNARNFFTFSIVTAVVFALTATAWAENGRGDRRGPPSATEKLAFMSEKLQLSDEQAQQLLPILQVAEEEQRNIRYQAMEAGAPEICANRAQTHSQIIALLDQQQIATFEQMTEQRRQRMSERQGGRGRGPLDCSEFEAGGS